MTVQTATIVTRYEVNTVQHEQGLDRIRQKQEQLKRQMADWNATVKHHEEVTARAWKTAALGLAGVTAAALAGIASFKSYAEQSRIANAALGADLERLKRASVGLKTETELLTFAAQAKHGVLKLNNEEMAEAQRAIRTLTNLGYDHQKVTEKVTEAIVKGETDGLKDLGVTLRETKSDTEKYLALKEKLAELAKKSNDNTKSETESIQALGTRFEDSIDKIKKSIGELVVSMEPLISAAAKLTEVGAGLVGKITQGWGALMDVARGDREGLFKRFGREHLLGGGETDRFDEWLATGGTEADFIASVNGGLRTSSGDVSTVDTKASGREESLGAMRRRLEAQERAQREAYFERTGRWPEEDEVKPPSEQQLRAIAEAAARKEAAAIFATLRTERDVAGLSAGQVALSLGEAVGPRLDEYDRPIDEGDLFSRMIRGDNAAKETARFQAELEAYRNRNKPTGVQAVRESQLAEIFGPIEEFDAYAKGFDLLKGAAQSAFSAWIDGSSSAGEAIKAFFAQSLKGQAVDLAGKAITHGAYAVGSLAFGDFRGAAQHGKAAAMAAAGAVALGGLAKVLGGGGSTPSAGGGTSGPAPSSSTGGGRGEGGGNTYVVSYNDAFTNESAHRREREARRLISTVMGIPGVVEG